MGRCWLKGATGDALSAVLAAAGYNLRWLLRAILDGKIMPVFLRLRWPRLWAELQACLPRMAVSSQTRLPL